MDKILRGLLAKALNKSEGEITELLKNADTDEAGTLQTILDLDAARIAKLAPKAGMTFEDGKKKGFKDAMTDFEKSVKEKYGVQSDLLGLELIDEVLVQKTPAPKEGEITEDIVKKHPAYQNLERKAKADLKIANDAAAQKEAELLASFNKKENLAVVKSKALGILAGLEPVLEENEQVATNRKNTFAATLESYDFELQGENIVVMKDGKVLDDGHGNTKAFADLVKEQAANHFVFKANNGGANGGNKNNPDGSDNFGGAGGKATYPAKVTSKPKNLDELAKITNDKTNYTLEERQQTMKAYEAENGQ